MSHEKARGGLEEVVMVMKADHAEESSLEWKMPEGGWSMKKARDGVLCVFDETWIARILIKKKPVTLWANDRASLMKLGERAWKKKLS